MRARYAPLLEIVCVYTPSLLHTYFEYILYSTKYTFFSVYTTKNGQLRVARKRGTVKMKTYFSPNFLFDSFSIRDPPIAHPRSYRYLYIYIYIYIFIQKYTTIHVQKKKKKTSGSRKYHSSWLSFVFLFFYFFFFFQRPITPVFC